MPDIGIGIKYKNGSMLMTHPSGHIDIISESDIDNWIKREEIQISRKRDEISDYMGQKQSAKNSL